MTLNHSQCGISREIMKRILLLLGFVSSLTAEITYDDKDGRLLTDSEFITIVLSTILGVIVVMASCLVVICIKWGDDLIDEVRAPEVMMSSTRFPTPPNSVGSRPTSIRRKPGSSPVPPLSHLSEE